MHNRIAPVVTLLVFTVALASAGGCSTRGAAAAAAGVAGAAAIVLNDQNAEAEIAGSMVNVDGRAKRVLRELGLVPVDAAMEDNATEFEYEARSGDRVVHVKLESRNPTVTKVSVSSRVGTTLNYDVSHARMIVQRIQELR